MGDLQKIAYSMHELAEITEKISGPSVSVTTCWGISQSILLYMRESLGND